MKEMEYTTNIHEPIILYKGDFSGFEYVIASFGLYPVARVKIPKSHPLYESMTIEDKETECHGGLVFAGDSLSYVEDSDGWWIGWNYSIDGDYNCSRSGIWAPAYGGKNMTDGQKWTTEEVKSEIEQFINQISEKTDNGP